MAIFNHTDTHIVIVRTHKKKEKNKRKKKITIIFMNKVKVAEYTSIESKWIVKINSNFFFDLFCCENKSSILKKNPLRFTEITKEIWKERIKFDVRNQQRRR